VLAVEKELLVPGLRSEWDAYNHGVRLLAKLTGLAEAVALGDYRPTDAAEQLCAELQTRLDETLARFDRLLADDLPAFRARLAEAKLEAVTVPE
jgi:hypothetical protein